jgi:ribosomal protein S18 acetylase RimI-like enzyme
VDPAFRRQGIGQALLRAADERHRQRAESEVAPDLPLIVTRYCRDTNVGSCTLLESEGYQIVRVTWFMQIDLAAGVEVPPLPAGVSLRPFDRERDAFAVYQAEQAMFRDNWGMVSPPYEVWQSIMLDAHHQDSLWLIAVVGEGGPDDPVIGLCLSRPMGEDHPDTGYIDSLAVRSDWRGCGLGSTLLRRGFQTIRAHGFTHAQLSVDSENQTNAVALYEKAGMHVNRRYLIYRKAVRGDTNGIWK